MRIMNKDREHDFREGLYKRWRHWKDCCANWTPKDMSSGTCLSVDELASRQLEGVRPERVEQAHSQEASVSKDRAAEGSKAHRLTLRIRTLGNALRLVPRYSSC